MNLLTLHVAISLVAIVDGFIVVAGMLARQRRDGWTTAFLITTAITCLTGFPLPADRVLPSHVVGVLTLAAVAVAYVARYPRRMAGGWRTAYVVGALVALYFNVFVLVVQLFRQVPALHALAPTESEPPFAVAQGLVLVAFLVAGRAALRRFHPRA
jgi:hypothetical protein